MNTMITLLKSSIAKKQITCTTQISKAFNIKGNRFLNEQYFHKKQNINNIIISNITKKGIINNNEHVCDAKDFSYKTYVSNNYKSHTGFVENSLYTKQDNITFNNTSNM